MTEKPYNWKEGAELQEHSRAKHAVQERYLANYIRERCKNPMWENFNFAIVDGFSGGGVYKGKIPGSPVILANTLLTTVKKINFERTLRGHRTVNVKCLMIMNDLNVDAIHSLKEQMAPCEAKSRESGSGVNLITEYHADKFENKVDEFIKRIASERYGSVLYYLDQCGYSKVAISTIHNLMKSARSVEVFLTYAIQSLLTFLRKDNPEKLANNLNHLGVREDDILTIDERIGKKEMLGQMERLVHNTFSKTSDYFSPFAINNPDGWKYWLMHFVKNAQGRVVFNEVLHSLEGTQAHCGGSGLKMFSHNPKDKHQGALFEFDEWARNSSREQLCEDVVRFMCDYKDETVDAETFLMHAFKETPALSDDIKTALIDSPDINIITKNGGSRRTHKGIHPTDIIKKNPQARFYLPIAPYGTPKK